MEKVIITNSDVVQIQETHNGNPTVNDNIVLPIKWWLKTIFLVSILCLPVACLCALLTRFYVRRSTIFVREIWSSFFSTILISSGLLTTAVIVVVLLLSIKVNDTLPSGTGLLNLDKRNAFPKLPSEKELSPQELAKVFEDMVFVVSAGQHVMTWPRGNNIGSYGAGVLIAVTKNGYLIATACHVIDGENWKKETNNKRYSTIRTSNGDTAIADVIARHKDLDIALLWVKHATNQVEYIQAIRKAEDIGVGEPVFAFGHPSGLLFSFTSGMVSGKREGRQIQITTPISPGSSGGPLYDSRGRLVGIVSWSVDKSRDPNAENLNFAAPVEDLLNPNQWKLTREGDKSMLYIMERAIKSSVIKATVNQPTTIRTTN